MEALQHAHVREATEDEKWALLIVVWGRNVDAVWDLTGMPDVIWGSVVHKLKADDRRWLNQILDDEPLLPEMMSKSLGSATSAGS
jgi:hypothetical protein